MTQLAVAFDRLVRSHQSEILAYLFRLLGNEHDAHDTCQDTWLRAYRSFGRLPADANVRAWLFKVATNSAFNVLRRRKRTAARSALVDLDSIPAHATAPLDVRAELRTLARAVNRLPMKQRAALMQRQFQGFEYDEIAACLNCTAAAARANVYQAIQKLRRIMDEDRAAGPADRRRGR